MNNNHKAQQSNWMRYLSYVDKLSSIGAIAYGLYLYFTSMSFLHNNLLESPAIWVICGSLSLVISFINLPKLMMNRMRSKMVISR